MKTALIAIVGIMMAGCVTAREPAELDKGKASWQEIKSDAPALEGHDVNVCGWFVADFEVCEVSASIPSYPGYEGRLWVAPKSAVCSLDTVTKNPSKGWADIVGTFRYATDPKMGFGQFGAYRAAIDVAAVTMRKAPCSQ